MDNATKVTITNGNKSVTFAYNTPFWISELRGASGVPVRIVKVQSLGQIGESVSAVNIESREMVLNGTIFEPIKDNRALLIAIFAPGADITIELDNGNNDKWSLAAKVSDAFDISDGVAKQDFQVSLDAVSPYWRSVTNTETLITGLTAVFRFPFNTGGAWNISDFKDDFFSTIVNNGNVPYGCDFSFFFQSQTINPEVLKIETNQFIRFLGEYNAGDSIIVQTSGDETGRAAITVTRANGQTENGYTLADFDSSFSMRIMPGENTFRAGAESGRENMTVTNTAPEAVASGV